MQWVWKWVVVNDIAYITSTPSSEYITAMLSTAYNNNLE
jgi:hypothetical protein